MATTVKSTDLLITDPKYPATTDVTKTVTKAGTNDSVTVDAIQAGNTPGHDAVTVFKVTASDRVSTGVDKGNVILTATGGSNTTYLSVVLNQADPANWTVNVNTSGGSNYTFTKGNGGGGH
ncbi:MAG TPA: hypothetical protein VKG92_04805 [Flavobacteriales bacterium]|nr:hypothetical protein [Flavobacteriales bacterium]